MAAIDIYRDPGYFRCDRLSAWMKGCCKHILYAGNNPVELTRRLFTVPERPAAEPQRREGGQEETDGYND